MLKANESCHVTATDLSPTAITMLREAAQLTGIPESHISAYAADGTGLIASQATAGDHEIAIKSMPTTSYVRAQQALGVPCIGEVLRCKASSRMTVMLQARVMMTSLED